MTWQRIHSTADVDLMADPFDTWEQFETPVEDIGWMQDNEEVINAARHDYDNTDREWF